MGNDTKICKHCNRELPLNNEYFAIFKRNKDGFATICKSCKREYDKEYRLKNKEKIRIKQRKYSENRKAYCKKWYYENQEYVKAYRERNKDKITEQNKKYWAENKNEQKERISKWRRENAEYIKQYRKINRNRDREQSRKWYNTERGRKLSMTKTNAYRAKKKQLPNSFTAEQWAECLEYFNHSCAYCGEHYEVLEQEHFIPVSKGGEFTKNNIVPSCRSCNASKLNHDFSEWYPKQKFYSSEREMIIKEYLKKVENGDSLSLF